MLKVICLMSITALAVSTSCLAQEKPTAEIRALNERVMREINTGLQCSTYNYTLEDRVKTAEAEVKRLTEKYEPKDDPAK